MKSTASVSETTVFTACRPFVWAAMLSVIIASTRSLAQTPAQRPAIIRGGLLFEHPLEAVAVSPAAAQEAGVLRAALSSANRDNAMEVAEALEAFVAENPSSVWTPSLRANLGRYYCTEGHWSKALVHWERAWDDTKRYQTGAGKRVGDHTLASWTRMLVELGRLDELQVIFAEAGDRRLDGGPLSQNYLQNKEAYGILRHRPEAAYRCGWQVLNQLAVATRGHALDPRKVRDLYQERNLLQSCSMSALAQIALNEQWPMIGLERPEGSQDLPIPSVMHLKQGHYVALLRADGGTVSAFDPIFGVRSFRRAVLNAESSGRFLLNAGSIPAGWRGLAADEMATTVGRSGGGGGGWYGFPDATEVGCNECGCPGAAGGDSGPINYFRDPNLGGGPGGSGSSCNGCGGGVNYLMGMPQWRVSEPNINLWLRDQPISCQPAYGPAVALELQFKQRNTGVFHRDAFNFGPGWYSPWLSLAAHSLLLDYRHTEVYLPGGGAPFFTFPEGQTVATNYVYNCRLTATLDNGQAVAYVLDFPDGRQYVYDYVWEPGSNRGFYMSRSMDQQGFVTRYHYIEVEGGYLGNMLRLDTVTDQADDLLFALGYTNGTVYSSLVSSVTNRFGQSAQLTYVEDDNGNPQLIQVQDAAGLPSTLSYNASGWPETLVTPYGSTSFTYDDGQYENMYYRRVRITEPNNGSQTYLFASCSASLWSGAAWMPEAVPAGLVPDANSLPAGSTLDNSLQPMNSFHWNQAQNSGIPTDLSQLTTNHMNKARMRHWLMSYDGVWYAPDFALSAEVAPSPSDDGSALGQITFYDYAGKPAEYPSVRGTQIQPSLVARKLPDGSTWYTAYARNSFGLPTSETSTYGTDNPASTRTYTYTYAANEQDLVERRGPGNVLLATYACNTRHQRTNEIVWPDSTTSYTNTWSYDAQGRLESKTAAAGQTTSYTYNGSSGDYSGYLSSTSEQPVQRTESFTWLNGLVRAHTDVRGLTVTNFWDGLNRLTGRLYPDGTTTTNLYTRAAAYPNGTGGLGILDVAATRDRLGNWTGFDYDALRRISARTNANGVITRYGYCDCGSASYITNAWGTPVQQVTTFTYDNQGNRTMENYADGYSVTNWFNLLGQTTVSGDGTGYRWYFYNNQGLLTTISNACGLERVILFDVHDRPEYAVDANGVVVANTHDNLGRLLTRTYPDDGVEGFGYTARGLVAYTNQIGSVTRYAYDEALRKTYETNANTEVLRFTNSAAGDLLSLTDGKNQTTRWSYDQYGRLTNKLDQASSVVLRYAYDAESRLTNRWSVAKGNTGYGYDAVGNLTSINYPASTDVALQYDWLNRLTNMVDAAGTTKYVYTAGNQLLSEDGPFASDTVTNLYVNRLRTALGLQQPTGQWTNGFGWDEAGRLSGVTSPAGTMDYTHTALYEGYAGRLVQQLGLPSGAYVTNLYDPVARLLSTRLKNSGGSTLDSALYGYNAANQRTAYTNAAGAYYQYTYDSIGQLAVADSTVSGEDRGYQYDTAWNLNRLTNNGTPYAFQVDIKNQLTNAYSAANVFDGNGNLTSGTNGHQASVYDDENRLVQWFSYLFSSNNLAGGDHQTVFAYDGLGRLRKRLEYVYNSGGAKAPAGDQGAREAGAGMELLGGSYWELSSETDYVYDGKRVIQERNGSNTPTVSYTRGSDLSGSLEGAGGIGGLLARSSGYSGGNWTSHAYYHADGNGNITCLINSSQSVVASYRYDPYGNTLSQSGTLAAANVYRFSSKEIHANSGMYYYLYRFYVPGLHRWLSRDPIQEHGGINLYCFVSSDPASRIDPHGLGLLDPGGPILSEIALLCACRSMVGTKTQEAEDWANANYGGQGAMHSNEGSIADMLTHCVASCELAKNEAICLAAGYDVRKAWQDRERDRSRGGDKMDYENNRIGFAIADAGMDCKQGCLQAFKQGWLWTVSQVPPYKAHPSGRPPIANPAPPRP